MLVPVIGLVQVGEQGHADRYTLPSFYRFVSDRSLAGRRRSSSGSGQIVAWCSYRRHRSDRHRPGMHGLHSNLVLGETARRFGHMLSPSPPANDFAHNNLGYLCVDRGELDKAMSHILRPHRKSGPVN